MEPVIKLIRTDTALDLSQKAEKSIVEPVMKKPVFPISLFCKFSKKTKNKHTCLCYLLMEQFLGVGHAQHGRGSPKYFWTVKIYKRKR